MSEQIKQAYITGYEQGHHDTVESCYGNQEEQAKDYVSETRPALPDDILRYCESIDRASQRETANNREIRLAEYVRTGK